LEANVFKGHKKVGSMNMGLQGSNTLHKPDRGSSIVGSGNRDNAAGTSSGFGRLGAVGGLQAGSGASGQMTYKVESQLQVAVIFPHDPTILPLLMDMYHRSPGRGVIPKPLVNGLAH
jgi:hypothetical protein